MSNRKPRALVVSGLLIIISLGCNRRHDHAFSTFVIQNSRPSIEEMFYQQNGDRTDTLLYMKYFLDNDSSIILDAKGMEIGTIFDVRTSDSTTTRTYNITYVSLEEPEKDSAVYKEVTEEGYRLTNFKKQKPLGKRADEAVVIIFDGDDFIYAGEAEDKMRMAIMYQFYEEELMRATGSKNRVRYRMVITHRNRAEVIESTL